MNRAFVGFYWTLPVPRRGFRSLPANVDAAARKSRTIAYQREVVQRFVNDDRGELVAEAAFMELAPDRASETIEGSLKDIVALCTKHQATLLYVDFAEARWRPRTYMMTYLKQNSIDSISLQPEEIYIRGQPFDPIAHFRKWKIKHESDASKMRGRAASELLAIMEDLSKNPRRYQVAADALNERGIKTATGKNWNNESARKYHKLLLSYASVATD